jgi:hypothetical protein
MRVGTRLPRGCAKEIVKPKIKPREIVAEMVSMGEGGLETAKQAWLKCGGRVRSHQRATAPE